MISQTFLKVYLKFKHWSLSLGEGALQKDFYFIIYSYFENVKVNVTFLKNQFDTTQNFLGREPHVRKFMYQISSWQFP